VCFSPQIEGELRDLRSHKTPSHRFDARGAPRQQYNERDRYQSNSSSRPKYDHHRNRDVRELISAKTGGGGNNSKRKISHEEEDHKEEQLQDKQSSMNNTSTAEKDDDDDETEERGQSNNKRSRNDKSAAGNSDDDDDRVRGDAVDDKQAANTTDIAEKAAEDQKPPARQPLQATKQRDRRMFGALMGHLGAARQDFKKNAALLETRQKVEEVCFISLLIVKTYMT
jgi:hypothetical protein